jgi:succinylglutamic semialdehyde dehydrogenase
MMRSLYINGEWIEGEGQTLTSFNPANGEPVWEGGTASVVQVHAAVAAAENAFPAWALKSVEERVALIEKYTELLKAKTEETARLISEEMGKPVWEARTEVGAMIGKTAAAVKGFAERCGGTEGRLGEAGTFTRFKPHGVVAVFGPFNFPGHLPNGHIVPALMAGNTVLFKPSKLTPRVGEHMARLWEEAGLPPGVFNLIQGSRTVGAALVACNRIAGIFFTGGTSTGRAIERESMAVRPDRILALEMGGNNPLVVWGPSDVAAAAYTIIQSAFITSGQRCVNARRLIVPNTVQGQDILDELVHQMKGIQLGPPTATPEPFMGPVVSDAAGDEVRGRWRALQARGARVLYEGTIDGTRAAFCAPGLIDVTKVSDLPDEEIFGPILQVTRVENFDAAIAAANATRYGLSAALLDADVENYRRFFNFTRAGIINWNRPTTGALSTAPFGGVGDSGNHRPSAYFAADYCSYPVASIEAGELSIPGTRPPGLQAA